MDKDGITRKYSNGELTIIWESSRCVHSGNCARGLASVFRPKEKPWIHAEAATPEEIRQTIRRCPSGALSFIDNSNQ